MTEIDVIVIIAMHTLGDWYFQPRWMALEKSSNFNVLLEHIRALSVPLIFASVFIFWSSDPSKSMFAPITWLTINLFCHAVQDWYIWRIGVKLFLSKCKTKEEAYNTQAFWNIVATDSFLHYLTYFVSLHFVKQYFEISR